MRFLFSLTFLVISVSLYGQVAKLGPAINRTGSNNYYPVVSGDGQYMLYRSDLSNEGHELWITRMASSGQWGLQERFNRVIDLPGVNTMGGFHLNIDGSLLVFSSRRYGGIGGFDIWISEKRGSDWGTPQNAGKPLNSNGHEGDPSLSPDGKTLYYIKCDGLNVDEAVNCSIWTAQRKSNGYFEEPVKLPAPINTGHETSPLILADNESLVFSSARPGGKGGLDLYFSRKEGDGWAEPIPMDFLNTEKDDRYVTIPARGDLAYFSQLEKGKRNLFMAKVPEEFQPNKVLYLESRVVSSNGSPLNMTIQYSPVKEDSKFITNETDGTFSLILREGNVYDLAVLDREGKYLFHSEKVDLTNLELSKKERKEFTIKEIRNGAIQPLNNIVFEMNSSDLHTESEKELQRLIFMMQKNSSYNVEIVVNQGQYHQDSIKSDPDLTELIVDTIRSTNIVENIDTIWHRIDYESLLHDPRVDYIMVDSVLMRNSIMADRVLDSLNNAITNSYDSFETLIDYDTIRSTRINYTYHNDRSFAQSFSVVNYLRSKGAPAYRLSNKGTRDDKNDDSGISVWARFYK